MFVIKRNGKQEPVQFDKVTSRIQKLAYGLNQQFVDPCLISQKVVKGVYAGVKTSDLDTLAAETAVRVGERAGAHGAARARAERCGAAGPCLALLAGTHARAGWLVRAGCAGVPHDGASRLLHPRGAHRCVQPAQDDREELFRRDDRVLQQGRQVVRLIPARPHAGLFACALCSAAPGVVCVALVTQHDWYAAFWLREPLCRIRTRSGRKAPLLDEKVYQIIMKHKEELDSAIIYDRDYSYDYFGFKTLERSYLLRVNGKIAERPQVLRLVIAVR